MKLPLLFAGTIAAAALTSAAVVSLTRSEPIDDGPSSTDVSERASDADAVELRRRVRDLESEVTRLSTDLADTRRLLAASRSTDRDDGVASAGDPDASAAGAPSGETVKRGDAPPDGETAKGNAESVEGDTKETEVEKARRAARSGIAAMLAATPEYEKRQRDRSIQAARDLAKRYGLDNDTARNLALDLIRENGVAMTQFRDELRGRDFDSLRFEDVRPLVKNLFDAREAAVVHHLGQEQQKAFLQAEAESRQKYREWLLKAFPTQ